MQINKTVHNHNTASTQCHQIAEPHSTLMRILLTASLSLFRQHACLHNVHAHTLFLPFLLMLQYVGIWSKYIKKNLGAVPKKKKKLGLCLGKNLEIRYRVYNSIHCDVLWYCKQADILFLTPVPTSYRSVSKHCQASQLSFPVTSPREVHWQIVTHCDSSLPLVGLAKHTELFTWAKSLCLFHEDT